MYICILVLPVLVLVRWDFDLPFIFVSLYGRLWAFPALFAARMPLGKNDLDLFYL